MTAVLTVTHEVGSHVTAHADGIDIVRYVYGSTAPQRESPRPYFYPLRTRGGTEVAVTRPHDHLWHLGLAWSLPYVGNDNFWGGPTYVHGAGYVQLENDGAIVPSGPVDVRVENDRLSIEHELHWITQGGRHVITEIRRIAIELVDDAWVLVHDTQMTNVAEETLAFGSPTTKGRENAGYGGFFWRGPRAFTNGRIRTAEGDGGEHSRGTTGEWMGFTGLADGSGRAATVVLVDDRENPRHPPQWFARTEDFAALCAAPFFSEELDLAPGQSLRFRNAAVIADDGESDEAPRTLADRGRDALVGSRS